MRVAVILVNMLPGAHHDAMQPIIFAILDRLTPEGVSLMFYDDRIEALPEVIEADLIALSVDTFSAARAYQLSRRFRQAGQTVVMGGIHPTSAPQEALSQADAIVIGEAEDTWPKLLRDFSRGELQTVYRSRQPELTGFDPNNPALQKGYLPLGIMETSRGCRHQCDFCSVKVLYPGPVRRKPLAMVEQELKASPHRLLFFVDDNLLSDKEYFLGLSRLLRKYRKRWAAQVSLELAQDEQLIRIAQASGAVLLLIGFESLSDDALRRMGKRHNRQADLAELVRRIHAHGLLLYATFVFGYPGDRPADVRRVLRFGLDLGISVVNFNPLQPMPGTPLYRRLLVQGRLKSDAWWLDPAYRYGEMAFVTEGSSPAELSRAIEQARSEFYRPLNSLRRWWRRPGKVNPTAGLIHFLLNHISRREIARKQNRRLYAADTD